MVDAVTFGGVRLSASMDVTSGKLLPAGQPGEYKAGGNYTLDDASPVYVEAILMPVGTAEGITVNVHVDGRISPMPCRLPCVESRHDLYLHSEYEIRL